MKLMEVVHVVYIGIVIGQDTYLYNCWPLMISHYLNSSSRKKRNSHEERDGPLGDDKQHMPPQLCPREHLPKALHSQE